MEQAPSVIGLHAYLAVRSPDSLANVWLNQNIDDFIAYGPRYHGPEIRALVDVYENGVWHRTLVDPIGRAVLAAIRLDTVAIDVREYLLNDVLLDDHFNLPEDSLFYVVMTALGQDLASLARMIEAHYRYTQLRSDYHILFAHRLFHDCVDLWRRWIIPWEQVMLAFAQDPLWTLRLPSLDVFLDRAGNTEDIDRLWAILMDPQGTPFGDLQELGIVRFYLNELMTILEGLTQGGFSNDGTLRFLNALQADTRLLLIQAGLFPLQQGGAEHPRLIACLFVNVMHRYARLRAYTENFQAMVDEPRAPFVDELLALERNFWRYLNREVPAELAGVQRFLEAPEPSAEEEAPALDPDYFMRALQLERSFDLLNNNS